MNRIFRVIWNHATQSWVAVSELTKAHKKSGKAQKIIVNSLVAATAFIMAEGAMAATTLSNDKTKATGSDGVAVGNDAGEYSTTSGNYNVAIGMNSRIGVLQGSPGLPSGTDNTTTTVNQGIAIGGGRGDAEGAWAKGDQSIAIGGNTRSDGHSSIAIGGDDVDKVVEEKVKYTNSKDTVVSDVKILDAFKDITGKDLLAPKYSNTISGHGAVAVGVKATASHMSVALGTMATAGTSRINNQAVNYDAFNTVAIGSGATADKDNSVAIGGGSNTTKAGTKQSKFTYNKIDYTWAGGDKTAVGDIVSFGSEGFERQLKNVAAGEVSQTSTDAINGSQLYGIVTKMLTHNYLKYAGDDGQTDAAQIVTQSLDNNKLNILGGADKDKLSDKNIGVNKTADGTLTVKLAKDLTGLDSAAIGGVTVNNAGIAMGDKKITGLKAGENPNDAVNKSQLDEVKNNPLTFTGNTGNAVTRKLGESLKVIGDGADITSAANGSDEIKFSLNKSTQVAAGDNKAVTSDAVNTAINAAAWKVKATQSDGEASGGADESISAGDLVELDAGKNIKITQANGKFTFATKDNVEFTTLKVGDSKDGKAPVEFKTEKAKDANNNPTANTPTTALNISSGTGNDAKPTQLTGVASTLNTTPVTTTPNNGSTPTSSPINLVNLVGDTANPVNPNAAATVGDLQNMGWVVSTKEGGYKDVVKNANEVQFVGTGIAKVTGKTDANGIRTITVNVDEAAKVQSPVVYTKADGTKVVEEGGQFYEVAQDGTADKTKPVAKDDVIASLNSGNDSSTAPTTLGNVKSNLPETRNTADATNPTAKPITTAQAAPEAADLAKIVNNAATVGDVLNAGWNLQGNGSAVDFVKPYDTVNFVNGKGTTVVVSTDDNLTSRVTFNVDAGEMTSNDNGSVKGPSTNTPAEIKTLKDNLKAAQDELTKAGNDEAAKKVAQEKIDAAEKAIDAAGLNKVATAQNVADMINNSGFTLKAGKTDGDNTTDAALANGEVINPGDTITMQAGKNMTVKQEADGKITYATKDDVEFNSVKVGDSKDGKAPVEFKTEAAKPATNNADNKKPTTALNISSGTGDNAKPTQLTGVGSTLNTTKVPTNPNGTATPEANQPSLIDLNGTTENPVNPNAAATVGDLQNMGWVVSTKGDGYKDVVKNANEVQFVGTGLATVTGKTENNIRTITVDVDAQKVVEAAQNPVVYTDAQGNKVTNIDGDFYPEGSVKLADGKVYPKGTTLKDGKPVNSAGTEVQPVDKIADKNTITASLNNGSNTTTNPAMTLGNVGSNLPAVNDTDKTASDKNGNPLADKTNKAAPISATEAANIAKTAGNNAATVSDVLNAGWNLQNNGSAVDFVKPFDTVNFVDGTNTQVVVSTDDNLTSKVQVNVTGLPITYTTADGTPVVKVGDKYFKADKDGKPTADEVKPADTPLSTNLVNPNASNTNDVPNAQTTTPTQLGNVAAGSKTFDAPKGADDKPLVQANDGKWYPAEQVVNGAPVKDAKSVDAPVNPGKAGLADFANSTPTNVATVADLQNMGWVVSSDKTTGGNGEYNDQVRNANEVKFVGKDGVVVSGKTEEGVRTITVTTDKGEITANDNGSVTGPAPEALQTALKNAKEELAKDPTNADKQKAVTEAENAIKNDPSSNKVATAQNVADMINNSGFTLKADKVEGGDNTTVDSLKAGEKINPGDTITMQAGKNMTVKQEADGKITYATKDEVEFNSVKVGDSEDGKAPVEFKTEKAKDATNNANDNKPTTALNISSGEGDNAKPTQLIGVGSTLNTNKVATNPNGKATPEAEQPALVDLVGTKDNPVNPNAAATVGDLQNMGWIVSTKDGNGYVDTVKNANKVDFKGEGLATITGKTLEDGTREITVSVKTGEVAPTTAKDKQGNELVKVGDNYYKAGDINTATGKPKDNTTPVAKDDVVNTPNNGAGLVTGNQVADAIQSSGFVIGKQKAENAPAAADYKDEDERVNPDDNVRFADGNNTSVKLATKESVDASGKKVTTTTVKVDVTGMPVQYTTADGTPVTKVGDKFFKVDAQGNPTGDALTNEEAGNLVTNVINPAAKPNEKGAPTTLGNVKSNLPQVNDKDKTVLLPGDTPADAEPNDGKESYIDAESAADLLDPNSKNFAGNNAATVSDVLNAGWNLQNNGEARDFVKPFDTVNFIDGKGTKAVVTTAEDGTSSTVKFDLASGEIAADKDKPGAVVGPKKALEEALAKAKADEQAATSPEDKQKAADAVKAAQSAVDNADGLVATASNVADMINNSGWFTDSTTATGEHKETMVKPGSKVNFEAGKNMAVTQKVDDKGNVSYTYETAKDVNFDSVTFGENGPKISGTPASEDGKTPAQLNVNNAKITGVADGDITPTSKDAVNGSQIYALTSGVAPVINEDGSTSVTMNVKGKDDQGKEITVEKTYTLTTYNVADRQEFVTNSVVSAVHNMNEQGIKFFHTNDGEVKPVNQDSNSIDSSASGAYATAIGYQATAGGNNAVAMGKGSQALAENTIAIGTGNIVSARKSGAFGDPNIVTAKTADGKDDVVGSYAFGNDNIINTSNTFVLGNDVNNAGNSTAMGSTVENSVYLGNKTTATAGDGSRTGTLKNIKQDGTAGETTTAGSTGTVSTATVGSMTYGGFAGAKADGVVSVGAAGNERRVQNVAAGEISATSTDAINGSQLYAVAKGVGDLNNRINKIGKLADAGIASALAASHIPQAYTPGKSLVGVGAGHYQGQSGIAVGMSRISDNGKYIIRFSGTTNSQGKMGVAAGFGYQW